MATQRQERSQGLVAGRPLRRLLLGLGLGIGLLAAGVVRAAVPAALLPAEAAPSLAQVQSRLSSLALPWVPNRGQWDERALYRAQSFAGSVWLTRDGALVYQFAGPLASGCESAGRRLRQEAAAAERCERRPGWVLVERFEGGRVGAVEAHELLPGRVSYQVGEASRHVQELPSHARLELGEVYPGVRVALKATEANVEKLYTVAPGVSPGVIRMRLEGSRGLRLGEDGRLIARTDHGEVAYTAPVAFQHDARGERVEVSVAYVLEGDRYGFRVGAYDKSRPLVIDPLLQSTYAGGGGSDAAYALAIHPTSGEVYVAGYTGSTAFPGTAGGAQASSGGVVDAFVARFNAALTVRHQSTYLGGGSSDFAVALAIHPVSGEVYVAGYTLSTAFPGTTGGAQATYGGGGWDAFVARFNAALTTLHRSTYLGGSSDDRAYALAIHPASGEVYVAGYTSSASFPGTAGGAQASHGGGTDAFVARFNAALTVRHQSTYLGGSGNDYGYALAIHPASGEVYVAGYTASSPFPGTAGGAQPGHGGSGDAFVARFNAALTAPILQSTYLGGSGNDYARALAIHPTSGEVYVAGFTTSTDFPGTTGGAQASHGGGSDAFVARFNAALTTLHQSTYLGGSDYDYAYALAIHPTSGEVYVAGFTDSTDFPGATGGAQAGNGGGTDAFVSRFTPSLAAVDVTISVSPASASENGGVLTYTVTRTGGTTTALTVNLTPPPSSSRYTSGCSSSITIPAGQTSAACTVTGVNNAVVDGDVNVTVAIAAGTGYTVGAPSSATGTLTDDDVHSVSIAVSPASASENGGVLTYTVTRTGGTATALTVSLTPLPMSSRYTSSCTPSITIPAGQTSATCTVTGVNNAVVDGDVNVTVAVGAGAGYTVGAPSSATGTLTDDDNAVSFSSTPLIGGGHQITVTRTGPTGSGLPVNLTLSPTPGTNYTTTCTSPITIPAGQTTVVCTITPTASTPPGFSVTATIAPGGYVIGAPSSLTLMLTSTLASIPLLGPLGLGLMGLLLAAAALLQRRRTF